MMPHHAKTQARPRCIWPLATRYPAVMRGMSSGSGRPRPQAKRRPKRTKRPPERRRPSTVVRSRLKRERGSKRSEVRGQRSGKRAGGSDVVHGLLLGGGAVDVFEELFEGHVVEDFVGGVGEFVVDE